MLGKFEGGFRGYFGTLQTFAKGLDFLRLSKEKLRKTKKTTRTPLGIPLSTVLVYFSYLNYGECV